MAFDYAKFLAPVALMVLGSALLFGQDTAVQRLPVPDAAAQKRAEKLVRDLYKIDYARRAPSDQQALAAKLVQQGLETKDDPAVRYVMFREGRDLALQAGSGEVAFRALDEIVKAYEVDAGALKMAAMAALGKTAQSIESCRDLAQAGLAQAEWFFARDDYAGAVKVLIQADAAARRTKEASLQARVQSRLKEVQEAQREHSRVESMLKTLKEKPDDPPANLQVGKFLCFVKGDWSQGLPMLVKGTDEALKAVATKDLEGVLDPESRVAAGDAWWALAAKQGGALQGIFRERALQCYKMGWKGVSGIVKQQVRMKFRSVMARGAPIAPKEADRKPAGWNTPEKTWGTIGLDTVYAWSGRYSLRVEAGDLSQIFSTSRTAFPGQEIVFSARVLTEETDSGSAPGVIFWKSAPGESAGWPHLRLPDDQPWWELVEERLTVPADAVTLQVGIDNRGLRKGRVWIDDVSIRTAAGGVDLADNGSFEK